MNTFTEFTANIHSTINGNPVAFSRFYNRLVTLEAFEELELLNNTHTITLNDWYIDVTKSRIADTGIFNVSIDVITDDYDGLTTDELTEALTIIMGEADDLLIKFDRIAWEYNTEAEKVDKVEDASGSFTVYEDSKGVHLSGKLAQSTDATRAALMNYISNNFIDNHDKSFMIVRVGVRDGGVMNKNLMHDIVVDSTPEEFDSLTKMIHILNTDGDKHPCVSIRVTHLQNIGLFSITLEVDGLNPEYNDYQSLIGGIVYDEIERIGVRIATIKGESYDNQANLNNSTIFEYFADSGYPKDEVDGETTKLDTNTKVVSHVSIKESIDEGITKLVSDLNKSIEESPYGKVIGKVYYESPHYTATNTYRDPKVMTYEEWNSKAETEADTSNVDGVPFGALIEVHLNGDIVDRYSCERYYLLDSESDFYALADSSVRLTRVMDLHGLDVSVEPSPELTNMYLFTVTIGSLDEPVDLDEGELDIAFNNMIDELQFMAG